MPSAYSAERRGSASPYPANPNPFTTPDSSRDSSIMNDEEKGIRHTVQKSMGRTKGYLNTQLERPYTTVILVVCFFTSGLIDSVAFNAWSCFVGMQTGNTVFAALGLSGQPVSTHRQQYYKSLVSIASFMLGTLFFNFLHRYPRLSQQPTARKRVVFILSFFVQTTLIIVAAILVNQGIVSNRPAVSGSFSSGSHKTSATASVSTTTNFVDLVPIALLAFEAAGQVCLSRVLEVIELPTIVLSTLYHDFTADLFGMAEAWRNSSSVYAFFFDGQRRQMRRAASMLALFMGGIVGGEMFKSRAGMSGGLFLAAGIKGGVCLAWAVWKGERIDEDDVYIESLPR